MRCSSTGCRIPETSRILAAVIVGSLAPSLLGVERAQWN